MISSERLKLMLYHIFLPNRCILCNKVTFYDRMHCDECNKSTIHIPIGSKNVYNFCESYSPYLYAEGARIALFELKFNKNLEYAEKFSRSMVRCLINNNIIFDFDVVISVPKYSKKKMYNSSYELAKRVAKYTNKPMLTSVLIKIKQTKKQHQIDYESRFTNLIGAFSCQNTNEILNKKVLLIDDVCTSGTTLNTCAESLLHFGAKKVTSICATTSNINMNYNH